jgi:hypothetical protein
MLVLPTKAADATREEHTMSTTPIFGTQLIGETEKTLNAILEGQLAGTGLSEPAWVTLTLAVMAGEPLGREELAGRFAGALHISADQARARLAELDSAGLLQDDAGAVAPSEAGRTLHEGIRANVGEITQRLWGDLPAEDLAIAARVLGTVLERARAELARA